MQTNDWSLEFDGFAPDEQGLREALCTLGNGYFATRGAGEEVTASAVSYPGTYMAGGYNRLETSIAGRTIENEDLVNFPNWLSLEFRADETDWLNLMAANILDYKLVLDVRHGLLLRKLRFEDRQGRRTRIESRRFVHMKRFHVAALSQTITAENWSGKAEVRAALDGRVINGGVPRYRQLSSTHLRTISQGGGNGGPLELTVETTQSGLVVSQAARIAIRTGDEDIPCEREMTEEPGYVAETMLFTLAQDEPVTVEKTVAIYCSKDVAISEPALAARLAVEDAPNFEVLESEQREAWDSLWRRAAVTIEDKDIARATLLVRLHAFHLLQTLSPNCAELDVGVPARGLHGEAYRGHVFWDELFVLPFYNARFPFIARSLLKYRHRRLDVARRLAREAGYRGAMFPWQSGSSGREESQRLHLNPKSGRWLEDNTYLQRHVSAAVAYNVWAHYQATGDARSLTEFGAEMLIEIGRFWASICEWNRDRGRYEIRGVVGPDEYHDGYPDRSEPGIDNNAYTNIMAAWCLHTAIRCLDELPPGARRDLVEQLSVGDEEIANWRDISTKMFVPFHDGGIISQFEGYEELEEFDWDRYREKYGDIQRLDRLLEAEGDTPNRYKLSKQADVLMLFYLFSAEDLISLFDRMGYSFDSNRIPKTIEYYLQRTAHGSSLSRVVHSWVLARLDRRRSWQLFLEALEADVSDAQRGTTAEGIHLGAMAATIDLLERCYTGREVHVGRLRLNPCIPDELEALCFNTVFRGNWISARTTHDGIRLQAGDYANETVTLTVVDTDYEIAPGQTLDVALRPNGG